jgi:hypothetical protein
VKNRARSSISAIAALLAVLLSGRVAIAEDYSIDFGADIDRGRDAGTVYCRFGQLCHAEMESLGLTVTVDMSRRDAVWAHVGLSSRELECCYFAEAGESMTIDPRQPLSRLPLFKGARARGELFIETQRVGILYLRFHFH